MSTLIFVADTLTSRSNQYLFNLYIYLYIIISLVIKFAWAYFKIFLNLFQCHYWISVCDQTI